MGTPCCTPPRNIKAGKTMYRPIYFSHDSVPAESGSRPWTSSGESRWPRTTEIHTHIAVFAHSALLTVAFPGLEAGRCSADRLRLFRRPCTMCRLGEPLPDTTKGFMGSVGGRMG
jgi:hypothetical protein